MILLNILAMWFWLVTTACYMSNLLLHDIMEDTLVDLDGAG